MYENGALKERYICTTCDLKLDFIVPGFAINSVEQSSGDVSNNENHSNKKQFVKIH